MQLPTLLALLPLVLTFSQARLTVVRPRGDNNNENDTAIAASQAKANATVVADLAANPLPATPKDTPAFHSPNSSYSSDTLPAVPVRAPASFFYGCATSAYQIEGSTKAGGRGESNWDAYVHNTTGVDKSQKPGSSPQSAHVANGDDAEVAMDFYNTYKQDILLFKSALGIDTFSFSIAWTRILPLGNETTPNQAGIDFYKDIIATAKAQSMLVACTLFHWDFPQALQAKYGGWLDDRITEDYAHYAKLTMEALGHGCDMWITVNEPRTFCTTSYGPQPNIGAPGFVATHLQTFECVHRVLLAHAKANQAFWDLKRKGKVHGRVGIKIDGAALEPFDAFNATVVKAIQPAMDMGQMGWILGPLTTGDYASSMRKAMGTKLPTFTPQQSAGLKDSYHFIAWDSYATMFAKPTDGRCVDETNPLWPACVELMPVNKTGVSIGEPTGSFWNFQGNDTIIQGMRYMHQRWNPKALAIGENGLSLPSSPTLSLNDSLHDLQRIRWYRNAVEQINTILDEGKIPFVGYLAWSCISNFEWIQGYQEDFGLIYAKPGANQTRYIKESATFLQASFANKESAFNVTNGATRTTHRVGGSGGIGGVAGWAGAIMPMLLVVGTLLLF